MADRPDLSVIVSTRDRGETVRAAIESVLASLVRSHELIIVDQSNDDATERCVRALTVGDSRVVYLRSRTRGLSRARNVGILLARADLFAFTDDDCVVPADWATRIVQYFASAPEVALWYGAVLAAKHAHGWTPQYLPLAEGPLCSPLRVPRSFGLGANFAVRRTAAQSIGPFDEALGAGSTFGAGEDTDIGYRAFRMGLSVHTTCDPSVVHHGIRNGREISDSASRYVRGMAAMCAKHARCGDLEMLRPVIREVVTMAAQGTRRLLTGRRPSGYRSALALLRGLAASMRYPIDAQLRLYRV